MGLQKERENEVGPPCVGGVVPSVLKVDRSTPVPVGSFVLVSVGELISGDVRVLGGVDAGKYVGVSWGFESGKVKGGAVSQAVGSQLPSSLIVGGGRIRACRGCLSEKEDHLCTAPNFVPYKFEALARIDPHCPTRLQSRGVQSIHIRYTLITKQNF